MSADQDIPNMNLASNRQLWRLNELGLLPTFWGLGSRWSPQESHDGPAPQDAFLIWRCSVVHIDY